MLRTRGALGYRHDGVKKSGEEAMDLGVRPMAPRAGVRAAAMAFAFVASAAGEARAKDLFDVNIDVTSPTTAQAAASAGTITQLIETLQTANLQALTSAYTNTSGATATLNIRGVVATATFLPNSTTLVFSMPSAGVNKSFTGATRNDSEQQLLDFLTKNGGSEATRVLQQLVASSPIDPVAGNPGSLQNAMAASDFAIGTGIGINGVPAPAVGPAGTLLQQPNLVALGGDVGVMNLDGYTSEVVTLPLRYTIAFADPRYALTFDLPLTYVNTQGASSFFGSFGASLRIPLLTNWYLTPSLRAGAAGSVDLGAAAVEYSGGVASRYDIFYHDLMITIGNGIDLVKTLPLSIGDIHVNYDLTNELWNNGVQVEGSLPYTMFGYPTSWQGYVVDTAVTGSKVYVSHYDEIGFTVGTRHGMNAQDWNSFRVGAGVAFGSHFNAYKAGFTYRF
jgi:hypothetical protein